MQLTRAGYSGLRTRSQRRSPAPNHALSTRTGPDSGTPCQPVPVVKVRITERSRQFIRRVLYGTAATGGHMDANREAFYLQHDVLTVQQQFFEDTLDLPATHRHERSWSAGEQVIRFDKAPKARISTWIQPDRRDPTVSVMMGGIKSNLTESGQIIPAGGLPTACWEETIPVTLANLAYQHVMSVNKARFQHPLPRDASQAEIDAIRDSRVKELDANPASGSPLTSFTAQPPMDEVLAAWGAAGSRIELSGQSAPILGPYRVAWMIMRFASVPGIDDPTDFAWRQDRGCFPDPHCEGVRKMERLLSSIGIDPDGAWTRREKAVFYVLVADEHLLIGSTPAGTAVLVETRRPG